MADDSIIQIERVSELWDYIRSRNLGLCGTIGASCQGNGRQGQYGKIKCLFIQQNMILADLITNTEPHTVYIICNLITVR